MYKIPLDINLEKIKGNAIVQICYTVNTISFSFENICVISTDGCFLFIDDITSFKDERKIKDIGEMVPINKDCGLLNLLEKKVINIEIDSERTDITFYFEENKSLALFGDPYYEAYCIDIEGKRIII